MIIKCWPVVIIVASWFWAVFLIFRVSAFRADRPDSDGYFGLPYFWNWKYLNPENFTSEGRPLLFWLWIATATFAAGGFLAMAFCV